MSDTQPTMKRHAGISFSSATACLIIFDTSTELAAEFAKFGRLLATENIPTQFNLIVDRRFDFDEVEAYIRNCQPEDAGS